MPVDDRPLRAALEALGTGGLTVSLSTRNAMVNVVAKFSAPGGTGEGRAEIRLRKRDRQSYAIHHEIELHGSLQGQNLARRLFRVAEATYPQMGIGWVEIEARGNGAYVWASEGYDFRPWGVEPGDLDALLRAPADQAAEAVAWLNRQGDWPRKVAAGKSTWSPAARELLSRCRPGAPEPVVRPAEIAALGRGAPDQSGWTFGHALLWNCDWTNGGWSGWKAVQ